MPEEKSAAKDLAEGVKSIFERLSEFFHIFDLSYIVSGVAAFGALSFLYIRNDGPRAFPFADWVAGVGFVIASYICGLLCFEAGRGINGQWFRRRVMKRAIRGVIAEHGLTSSVLDRYPATEGDPSLYARLWAEVSERHSGKVAFRHLSRFWVMAATYDGVGAALLLWAGVVMFCGLPFVAKPLALKLAVSVSVLFMLAATMAFNRGAAYFEYQLEDLVATLAAAKEPLF